MKGGQTLPNRTITPGRRYREIARILARHGFGFLIQDLGLSELLGFYRRAKIGRLDEADMHFLPERIRQVLEELGPTFVKIGQFLSTRSDVIPENIIIELRKLQESAKPVGAREIRKIIEKSWNKPLDDVCAFFDDDPIGAASIGQVHRAVLIDGDQVAIKVRRPDIVLRVQADLAILKDLSGLAEERWEWARRMSLTSVVKEFSEAMNEEMNYQKEALNIGRIARQKQKNIRIPKVYKEYSSDQVLVMEYIDGIRLDDKEALEAAGVDCKKLAEQLIHGILKQMLEYGYYHADPHPGNIRVIPTKTLLFLDFGLLGRLGKETRQALSSLIISLMMDDNEGIADVLVRMGAVSGRVDQKALCRDVEQLRQEYYGIPLEEIHIGETLEALWRVAARHQVRIPPNMALLARTVMTLEGVIRQLVPKFNILSVAEPYAWKLLTERLHPLHLLQESWSSGRNIIKQWTRVPKEIQQLVEDLQDGKIQVQLTVDWQQRVRNLENGQKSLQKSTILLGMVVLFSALLLAPQPDWHWLPDSIKLSEFAYGFGIFLLLWLVKIFFFG